MGKVKLVLIVASLVFLIGLIFTFFAGDGGLARMTTISGIYVVKEPSGYPVTCFIEKSISEMHCLPNANMGD